MSADDEFSWFNDLPEPGDANTAGANAGDQGTDARPEANATHTRSLGNSRKVTIFLLYKQAGGIEPTAAAALTMLKLKEANHEFLEELTVMHDTRSGVTLGTVQACLNVATGLERGELKKEFVVFHSSVANIDGPVIVIPGGSAVPITAVGQMAMSEKVQEAADRAGGSRPISLEWSLVVDTFKYVNKGLPKGSIMMGWNKSR